MARDAMADAGPVRLLASGSTGSSRDYARSSKHQRTKSRSETKTKTELIVIVTPETAQPVAGHAGEPFMPKPFLGPAGERPKP